MLDSKYDLRLMFFIVGFLIMFGVEALFSQRAWETPRLKRLRGHLTLAAFNTLVVRLLIVAPFAAFAAWTRSHNLGLAPWLGLTGIPEILATVVVLDYADYWKHRWFHRVPLGWRFHKVHHTDTHLDVTSALRYHAGELAISAVIKAGWIVIWGPSVLAFMVFETILNAASQFHHSNIDLGEKFEKVASRIFVTPRYHAGHHTVSRKPGDYNFSTIFSVWDIPHQTQEYPALDEIDFKGLGESPRFYLQLRRILMTPFSSKPIIPGILPSVAYDQVARQEAVLLDVRESDELEEGWADGAVWIPMSKISSQDTVWKSFVQQTPNNKKVIVYCAAGARAQKVATQLQKSGLASANMGGFDDWTGAGLPVVRQFEEMKTTSS